MSGSSPISLHRLTLRIGRWLSAALLGSACLIAPAGAAAPYVVQSNGTVANTSNGLVWDQCSLGLSGSACATGAASKYTLSAAQTEATTRNTHRYKGYTDWRVPNRGELESLVVSGAAPTIDTAAFPGTVADYYKSSTITPNPYNAWAVDFSIGYTYPADIGYPDHVRLVRSGQPFASSGSTPGVSAVALSNTIGTGTTLNATSSAAGTGYWLVVPGGSAAPSARQVVDGVTYGSVSTVFGGSAPMSAATATPFGITGLLAGTAYDAYFVALDAALNASAVSGPLGFTPTRANQTLSFGAAPSMVFGGATGAVTATSTSPNSGNAISYSVPSTPSVCSVNPSSGVVTALAAGACIVAANQAGDGNYNAAAPVTQSILIAKASQSITFGAAPSKMFAGATATVSATGGASGAAVSFSSQTPSVCTVSGTAVTAVAAGACTVAADQAGNANYSAAPQVTRAIAVAAAPVTTASGSASGGGAVTATFTGGSAGCGFQSTGFNPVSSVPAGPPAGVSFPQGVFQFVTTTECAGNTLNFTIDYAQALPPTAKYYKFGPEANKPTPHWYVLSSAVITSTGSTSQVRFSITDNGDGDSDPTVGVIADPGGPGVLVDTTAIPTLGEWGLALLMGLLAISALRARRML